MDVTILDSRLEKEFYQLCLRINKLQSGGTIDSLHSIGVDPGQQIGASYVSLKMLAKEYQRNEKLALLLWNCQKREEQLVACFLFSTDMNREKITQLMTSCISFEIAGYMGSIFIAFHPEFDKIAPAWMASGNPYLQASALTATASHLVVNKDDSLIESSWFKNMIQQDYPDKYVQMLVERYRFNI